MIVDASAIVAIMAGEPRGPQLATRLTASPSRMTHPVSVYEATLAIARITKASIDTAREVVRDFLTDLEIVVLDLGPAETVAALDAFARYGKGRHPAKLNMGDCFSYACARVRGMPLLYKGGDFARTDLA